MQRPSALHTTLSWIGIGPLTVGHAVPAMVAALAGNRSLPETLSRSWCRALLGLAGAPLRTQISPELDPDATYIFASNHQSHLDVPAILLAWPGPVRFVAKRSLFAVPIFGQALAALGHIPVDRGNSEKARASLERAVAPVRSEVSVLFFAEGTRTRDGAVQRFKKGAVAMAEVARVPVVPVAVAGTRGVLPRGSGVVRPGPVAVAFGPPLEGLDDAGRSRESRTQTLREAVLRQLEAAESLLGRGELPGR